MNRERTGLERLRGSRVAIWGAGLEGVDVARAALARGAAVVFVDDKGDDTGSIAVDGVEIPVRHPGLLAQRRFDYLVRSPGVSAYRDELSEAARSGCAVTSATAMWLEDFAGSRIVGVTGTKGKTTTAWLTALVLEAAGLRVALGGNMGTPLTALYAEEASDVYVVEVSSFQAADVSVSPPVGMLTLLAPDHLDWHRGYHNYVRDKLNLFAHRHDVAVAVNASSPDAVEYTDHLRRRTLYGARGRVRAEGGGVLVDDAPVVDAEALPLRGEHNLANLCGALTVCMLAGEELPGPDALARALQRMPVLPSRLETVGTRGAIEFVNDALASNPAGTVAALRAFSGRRICLIAGGQDRGVDLGPLVRELAGMCPRPLVVTLPDLGARLRRELGATVPEIPCTAVRTVREAVEQAVGLVEAEGVVLFSPAAPTPVVEGSYVQRGATFNRVVAELAGTGA